MRDDYVNMQYNYVDMQFKNRIRELDCCMGKITYY